MRTNMSAPRPVMPGSTSPCTAHVAIAASTALPPAFRIRRPASAASGCPAATMPCCATTVGRQLLGDWAAGCARKIDTAAAATSERRVVIARLLTPRILTHSVTTLGAEHADRGTPPISRDALRWQHQADDCGPVDGRGDAELFFEVAVKVLLAPIPDEKTDRFDFLTSADQGGGVVQPHLRQEAVNRLAGLVVKERGEVPLRSTQFDGEDVERERLGITLLDEGEHSRD